MLTIGSIRSAGRAADYYGRDDYYVSGEADAPGLEWKGQGSASLGLKGTATHEQFKAVLEGKDPSNPKQRLTRGKAGPGGEITRKPGWDLTYSASKSTSLLILVGGDTARDQGFIASTEKAMAYAEKWFSVTRVRDEQGRVRERITGNLVYGQTIHGTSREGDPQRHVHYPLANATFDRQSGEWRALESKHLFKHQVFLGRLQRAHDIAAAKGQGYDVRVGKDETWEVDGFSRAQLMAFSKARARVEATLERSDARSPAAKDAAILKERPKKIDVPRHELQGRWKQQAERLGLDPERIALAAEAREAPGRDLTPQTEGRLVEPRSRLADWAGRIASRFDTASGRADPYAYERGASGRDLEARQAVSFALQVAEQRRAVFTRHEVLDNALKASRLQIAPERLEREIRRLQADGKIVPADKHVLAGVTTTYALRLERAVVEAIEAGRGRASPPLSLESAEERLSAKALTARGADIALSEGQRAGALKILSSEDRFVAIQGYAGAGKTTMFSVAGTVAAEHGHTLVAIAPTHRAVLALQTEAGLSGRTVSSFLLASERIAHDKAIQQARSYWRDKTLIVDEASMLSNDTAHRITLVAEKLNITKVVFVGDERQLGSPQAGAPFRLLLDEHVDQARLTDIRRQHDAQHRAAVVHLANGEGGKGLTGLGDRVVAIGRGADDQALAKAGAAAWQAGRAAGAEPALIVPTNALRGLVAAEVRQTLKEEGVLAAEGTVLERYYAVNLQGPERHRSTSYEIGQRLIFHSALRSAKISRGDEAAIVGLDHRTNRLVIESGPGRVAVLDLAALSRRPDKFQTFTVREHEVAVGERLVWERADPKRGLMTGAAFEVIRIDERSWTVRHASGAEQQFSADDPALKFAGYGYAETADRAQGQTYRSAVAILASRHGEAANTARAYVMASRPAEQLTFITDDKALLRMRLNAESGLNAIALQALRDAEGRAKDQRGHADAALPPAGGEKGGFWREAVRVSQQEEAKNPSRDGDGLAALAAEKDDKDRAFVIDVPMPPIDKTK